MKQLQWIVGGLGFLVDLMRKGIVGNAIAMLCVGVGIAWAGKNYVDSKHYDIATQVKQNTKAVSDMEKTQLKVNSSLVVVNTNLENVAESMKDLKKSVETLDQRVYDLQKTIR